MFQSCAHLKQLCYLTTVFVVCQQQILFILKFIIERRWRDLNPRAGRPTYTLSRGASSATWVHLLAWKFATKVFYFHHDTRISTRVHWLVYQRKCFLSTFFLLFFKIIFAIVYIVDTIIFSHHILYSFPIYKERKDKNRSRKSKA